MFLTCIFQLSNFNHSWRRSHLRADYINPQTGSSYLWQPLGAFSNRAATCAGAASCVQRQSAHQKSAQHLRVLAGNADSVRTVTVLRQSHHTLGVPQERFQIARRRARVPRPVFNNNQFTRSQLDIREC